MFVGFIGDSGESVPFPTGYRTWAVTRSFVSKEGRNAGFHHYYANPQALEGFATGKFPDGAVLMDERPSRSAESTEAGALARQYAQAFEPALWREGDARAAAARRRRHRGNHLHPISHGRIRMNRFSVLIVDDEPLARDGLRMLLTADTQLASISEAKNGREALTAIRESRPDLIFLDVQMPEMDGFDVVKEVVQQAGPKGMPAGVFVTAHDQYAIQAFEINALDYLLKPVTAERFHQSLERAKARLGGGMEISRRMISLLETMADPSPYTKRLAVRSGTRTFFVPVDDIEWIQAAENYVELHSGERCHLLHGTMNAIEASLDLQMFLRIHRSLIVNVGRIRELQPAGHGEYVVALRSGVRLQSSRGYHEKLKALASNPF